MDAATARGDLMKYARDRHEQVVGMRRFSYSHSGKLELKHGNLVTNASEIESNSSDGFHSCIRAKAARIAYENGPSEN